MIQAQDAWATILYPLSCEEDQMKHSFNKTTAVKKAIRLLIVSLLVSLVVSLGLATHSSGLANGQGNDVASQGTAGIPSEESNKRPVATATEYQEQSQKEFAGVSPEKIDEIAAKVLSSIPQGKTVAFVEFTDATGNVTNFSQSVFLQVEPIVLAEGNRLEISFIERSDLKFIMDEWDLKSLYHNEQTDQGAQTLLGADYILTGKAFSANEDTFCNLKLVDLSNGKILSSVSGKTNDVEQSKKTIDDLPAQRGAAKETKNISVSEDSNLTIWTDRKVYAIGDNLEIFFSVNKPLYVHIIDITPEGDIIKIFPNDTQKESYCVPNTIYKIPPEKSDFELLITPPKGVDRIKAIADTQDLSSEDILTTTKTRGIQFTKSVVNLSETRANLSIVIE